VTTSASIDPSLGGLGGDSDDFLDLEICDNCRKNVIHCFCHDGYYDEWHDDVLCENSKIKEAEAYYCFGCYFPREYCECWEVEWDFTSDMDDFGSFPEVDEMPRHIVRRLDRSKMRKLYYDYNRRFRRARNHRALDNAWKRQVREPRQWARHAWRILATVHPLGIEEGVFIRDSVENMHDQRTHEFVAQNIVRRNRNPVLN